MQLSKLMRCLLSMLLIFEFTRAKPSPGSYTRLSITANPPVPARVYPVDSPVVAYNSPVLAYNVPLDAALASQRIDVHQRYNYLPPVQPIKVIPSPYVEPGRLIYASLYPVAAPYYAPSYVVPFRYSVPVGHPASPWLI